MLLWSYAGLQICVIDREVLWAAYSFIPSYLFPIIRNGSKQGF